MLDMIISGGQTGADQAVLDAADLAIPHGGWVPKGRLTEAGPLPSKCKLKEMPSKDYLMRTRQNVHDSDGTVIFSHGELTGGSKRTVDLAVALKKPWLHINLEKNSPEEAVGILTAWIRMHKITVLNVAGSRASKDPKIYHRVRVVMELALQAMKEQEAWKGLLEDASVH